MSIPQFAARPAALLGLLLAACGDPSVAPSPLRVEGSGRPERGAALTLRVMRGTALLPAADVRVTAEPAGAAEFLPDGRLRLLQAGPLRLVAHAGGESGEIRIQVASPPRVVFQLARDGNTDIHSVALDGGEARRLTTEPALDQEPSSAAGKVVFASNRDGAMALFSVPANGGTQARLGTLQGRRPALSPSAARLAFIREEAGVPRLWLANGDGTGAAAAPRAAGAPAGIDDSPSFAPAGDRLVFMSTRAGSADLWTTALNAPAEPLVTHPAAEVEPAWSPDGRRVAFVSTRDGNPELYLVDVATRAVTRLTTTPVSEGEPAWLPDGRIVYTVFGAASSTLHWLNPDAADDAGVIPIPAGAPSHPSAER